MAKEVILMEDVAGLGDQGAIVRVSDGYARNYLLPRKLAAPVTDATRRMIEKRRKEYEAKKAAEREKAAQVAQTVAATQLTIKVRVGAEQKMYGSVTALDLVDAAQKQGLTLDKKQIELKEPLRELGEYKIPVKLFADIQPELVVRVVEE
jgi:large subunit ribosomal protein L9